MITVFTGAWGSSHQPREVKLLRDQVADNLSIDHHFVCISDRLIEGVACVNRGTLPGWWRKLEVLQSRGPAMWLDLDVVVTGSLDDIVLAHVDATLACPWNWAQSGHGGCQSSLMLWSRSLTEPMEHFDPADAHWPPRNDLKWDSGVTQWGDQEWLTHMRDTGQLDVEPVNPAWVKSYKYHCRGGVPDDCRLVVFHGQPKPSEAMAQSPWIRDYR